MNPKLLLFTGEEKYLIFQEIGKRKKAFEQKHGAQNIFEYKSDIFNPEEILRTIFDAGLFTVHKLVIIRGVPTDSDKDNKITASKIKSFEEQFENYVSQLSQDVVTVFISFKPDKRTTFYKFFTKNATVKEFNQLKENELKERIIKQAGPLSFESDVLEHFIFKVGTNLFFLENEIRKLLAYCQSKALSKVTIAMIDMICIYNGEINNFDLIDNLLSNKKKSLLLLESIQKDGTDRNECIGMLYRGRKILLQVIDMYQAGITSASELAKTAGMHPFVASKYLKQINLLISKKDLLKKTFSQLLEIDLGIKTGKLPKELFRLEIKKIITTLS